jgi:hypothetical protein
MYLAARFASITPLLFLTTGYAMRESYFHHAVNGERNRDDNTMPGRVDLKASDSGLLGTG